jgi:formylglycine-generating enzyme required for sulfatase activity
MIARAAATLAVALSTNGCWLVLGLEDNEYTRAGAPAPGERVLVDDAFYIDATEVTMRAYVDWVLEGPSVEGQDARCSWNDSYEPGVPSGTPIACPGPPPSGSIDYVTEASLHPNQPARCVDWCDAIAYCTAHGGHLCGLIGGGPISGIGSEVGTAFVDASISAWFAACTGNSARAFPYGDTYEPGRCRDVAAGGLADVGTESCEGGAPGVFDMSGNIQEWLDVCSQSAPEDLSCFRGGGSYLLDDPNMLDCADPSGLGSNGPAYQNESTGFRCCAAL